MLHALTTDLLTEEEIARLRDIFVAPPTEAKTEGAQSSKSYISVYFPAGAEIDKIFDNLAKSPDALNQALMQLETALSQPYSPIAHQSTPLPEEATHATATTILNTPFGYSRVLSIDPHPCSPKAVSPPSKARDITPEKPRDSAQGRLITAGREALAEISHQQSLQFLARSEQKATEIEALGPSSTPEETATRLIQKALLLMDANNIEKDGFFTYHTRFHAAEMVMDNLKKLTEASKSWSLSPEEKKLLILLGVLCAAYHDAYFRGGNQRGLDEATCAEILTKELRAEGPLRDLIYAIIVGGTLPTFSERGATFPVMLPIASDPRYVDQDKKARIPAPLQDVIKMLGKMDVHRTEQNSLRDSDPARVQHFEKAVKQTRTLCGTSLNGIHRILRGLAEKALHQGGYRSRSTSQLNEWINALLDKLGQNFRTSLENGFFLTEKMHANLPHYRAYLDSGRDIAKGAPLVQPGVKPDVSLFKAFAAEANFAHLLNRGYQQETGHTTALWQAHIIFMKSIATLFSKPGEAQQRLLEYSLLRAGCQDGVVFADKILRKDFNIMHEIDPSLVATAASKPRLSIPFERYYRDATVVPTTHVTSTAAYSPQVGHLYSPPRVAGAVEASGLAR